MDTPTQTLFAVAQPPKIEKLAKALIAASKELKNPPKTKRVSTGKYTYEYADLADVIDTVRPVLAKHGLTVCHVMDRLGEGWALTARIIHESGEYLDSLYPVPKGISGAQELGGWLTYMRRYSTCNLLFVSGETDDDGDKATAAEQEATDKEALEDRRKDTPAVEKAKAEGRIKSAHDGKVLEPGEAPAPEERTPGADRNPDLDPQPSEDWTGIPTGLVERMRRDSITPSRLMEILGPKPKGSGLLAAGTKASQIPEDMAKLLQADSNWQKVVNKAKGAK